MTPEIPTALLLGTAGWTLAEYAIHRFLGHDPRTRPNPFATEHVRHHGEGNYFAPGWKKACAAAAVAPALLAPTAAIAGWGAGLAWVGGFLGTYLAYEVVHRRQHTHPGFGPYGRWLRRHHFHHHFTDPRANHGVTTPLWDWVFGTFRPAGFLRVPARLQMPWLVDPATGRVRAAHAAHYEIVDGPAPGDGRSRTASGAPEHPLPRAM